MYFSTMFCILILDASHINDKAKATVASIKGITP